MDCPPVSSVHGILQARILEWVATSSVSQNLLKFMSPLPASNPRKQFASDSHSQSGYICLNQRALFTFSSLPLCFHIFRCFLLIPCVWSKKIYLIVNFTNLTWSWFSKYAAQLSEQKNDKKKKNTLIRIFFRKKTASGKYIQANSYTCQIQQSLLILPICAACRWCYSLIHSFIHEKSKYWELITCAWLGAHDMAVHKATAPWHSDQMDAWPNRVRTRRDNMITIPVIALIH